MLRSSGRGFASILRLAYGRSQKRGGNLQLFGSDMGDFLRIFALIVGLVALALPAAALDGPTQGGAGKKPAAKQAAAKQSAASKQEEPADEEPGQDKGKSAVLVQQIFEGGIKAYQVGKYEEAQRAFEAAIRTGMPSEQMPRVLYYRGLTFRKLGKPGFAVSDLTSALWLKGGLSEAERADAIKARALAYHESGVSDVPPVPQSTYAEAPALPGRSKTASAAAAASDAPAASSSAPASSSSGGIGGFFSGLFGGGSSSEQGQTSTASIPSSSPAAESTGWGAQTEVAPQAAAAPTRAPEIAAPFVTQVASIAAPEPAAAAPLPVSGGIRLQVAAVRSRSEAEALAGLLVGRHSGQLGGRRPEVDKSVIGSMGTFYRVRLGPYASEQEPQQLCVALRADGFDCLVVTE